MPPAPNRFFRGLFSVTLALSLLSGLGGVLFARVKAAPAAVPAAPGAVVISEFRFLGPAGAEDEFIEIHNTLDVTVEFTNLQIEESNNAGSTESRLALGSLTIEPGRHLLFVNKNASSGLLAIADETYNSGIPTDGGIALFDGVTLIDQVGLSAGSAYKEGTALAALNGTADQSYSRLGSGCIDSDNNSADFLQTAPSNPQNSIYPPVSCLRVINVTSTTPDGAYTAPVPITVDVVFSSNVNVTGTPTLLLETGLADHAASYDSGSGTNTLTFNYTVQAGDASPDLDYVSTDSLSLSGGTITGAVGNANLTLPAPGAAGSLSANKAIELDDDAAPKVISILRSNPITRETNAGALTFRATFSEPVTGVGLGHFIIHDNTPNPTTTAGVTGVSPVSLVGGSYSIAYDVTVSGVDLGNFNGEVSLDLANIGTIKDAADTPNSLQAGEPSAANDQAYTVDHVAPSASVTLAGGQNLLASGPPVRFVVTFTEVIAAASFTVSDIEQLGTIPNNLITWVIEPTDDPLVFNLSATTVAYAASGTLQPSVATSSVNDPAGNLNTATLPIAIVTYHDTQNPTVTVSKASGQADPTNAVPIRFTATFSEPIIASIFTPSDITQSGTASGVSWSITDTGNHTVFTLTAVSVGSEGTVAPTIAANRVTDYAGNNNVASTSAGGSVMYEKTAPTVTVNQANGQTDPTANFPINFTVVFSEALNVASFTTADITQSGTASGINWTITDSGDHKTFTLAATNLTRSGTLTPSIAAGKVTDLAGNGNLASTSTDNTVTSSATVPTPTRTPTPTATPKPPQTLIINEVAWMGTATDHDDEWIELWNPGSAKVDLTGWKIRTSDGTVEITLSGEIAAGGFYIIAPVGTFQDLVINRTISFDLVDGGKSLQLVNASSLVVDTANPDGGAWPAGVVCSNSTTTNPIPTPVPNTCTSMERDLSKGFGDAHWYTFAGTPTVFDGGGQLIRGTPGYANWAISVTATATKAPTPTRTPTRKPGSVPTPAATVVINEFMPRAGFDWNQDGKVDVFDEFIEVANLGPVDVNLSGWKLDDAAGQGSSPFTLPNKTLKPGERAIFYAAQTNILLSDGGDTVRLLAPNNVVKDAQTYPVIKVADQSWCRLPDINGSWYADCFPTPNQRNTREGQVPDAPPGTGLEEPLCLLPDTLPEDFRQAECFGYGANMWQALYWDALGWFKEFFVPQDGSKWETFVQ